MFPVSLSIFPGFRYDVEPVCQQERIPQQAQKHAHGFEHRFFFAAADADDDDLAGLLHG